MLMGIGVLARQVGVDALVVRAGGVAKVDRAEVALESFPCRLLLCFGPPGTRILQAARSPEPAFQPGRGYARRRSSNGFRMALNGIVDLVAEVKGQSLAHCEFPPERS